MQHMSRDSLAASVLPLMVVGVCYKSAFRKGWGMDCGMSVTGMLANHLACLLARRIRPYAAELKVGRVTVKEYVHVRRCAGITSVVPAIGSSSSFGVTGYVECSCTCMASRHYREVGSPAACIWVSWWVMIEWIVSLWLTSCGR